MARIRICSRTRAFLAASGSPPEGVHVAGIDARVGGIHEDGVDDAEDCGGGRDAEGQGDDGVKVKAGVFLNYVFLSYAGAGCRLQ